YLRYVIGVSTDEIDSAHRVAKRRLMEDLRLKSGLAFDENAMTIGFARRAATYKRFDLLFSDTGRLREISENIGPLQIIYGGKAHPNDGEGKAEIAYQFFLLG